MIGELLRERIRQYGPANAVEQDNVLQEIMQHFVLAGLSRSGFFSAAAFHGGTCLRILYGTSRFSEDLDFLLREPDPGFAWGQHLDAVRQDCLTQGIRFEAQERSATDSAVRKAFLKTDSIGQILELDLPFSRQRARKVRIKLEVDTNPPAGSAFETHYITFPVTSAISTQTLASSFALKSHALLCREYAKGRDWHDFLWYVARKTRPDLGLLAGALDQQGPWAGRKVQVTPEWYLETMRERIQGLDWATARADVERFLPAREQESLALWEPALFLYHLERLGEYLQAAGRGT
ncbi:MAG TPA: nucleotidyl transferase AbiEii/AbiGii toxin family protein [Planctomycetota bacterium]|nr:nucleotidyl transferase AbiEii/AbiGii toxin family protein [Planctomycetota bacterium]